MGGRARDDARPPLNRASLYVQPTDIFTPSTRTIANQGRRTADKSNVTRFPSLPRMANSRIMVKGNMNGKRISALAIAALLSMAAPAMATNPTGTVTVKWNTQALANMTLVTQSVAPAVAGNIATHNATPPTVYQNFSGATTTAGCAGATNGTAGTTGGTDASANLTVNYGAVTPDSTVYVDCY